MLITSDKLKDTAKLAALVAQNINEGDVILLDGYLGAGKTAFVKEFAKAIGVNENVTSPTFTFMKEYSGDKFKLYHFDMYRVEDESELYELGLFDYIGQGVCCIEWNKFKDFNNAVTYEIKINVNDRGQRIFDVPDLLLGVK